MSFETAGERLALLRAGQLSACELLEQTFERIDQLNPALNAIIVQDREGARRTAIEADKALARGESRPLLGLPMTVKECFDIAGMPTTWGLPGTEKIPVRRDAVVVRRLREAGAIVFGKTNVPPNLADWQSSNPIYGTTNNPWDLQRTPGGSSGGAAAALAAGMVALEMGTDIGGSLRVPAHFCGVYAHKSGRNLVPMRGCAPPGTPVLSVSNPVDLAVAGPMARSAQDLELAFDVVAGPDDDQARGYRLSLPAPRRDRLRDFRVLALTDHPLLPTSPEVGDVIGRLVGHLARSGCKLAETSPLVPDLTLVHHTYSQLLLAFLGATMPASDYEDLCQAVAATDQRDGSPQALELRALTSSHRAWIAADRVRTRVRDQWQTLFEVWDIVLCPVMPLPALLHDKSPMSGRIVQIGGTDFPYSQMSAWAGPATLAGLPATTLPAGIAASGLPVGVQAIGGQFEDKTTMAFARLVGESFGGFIPPPPFR